MKKLLTQSNLIAAAKAFCAESHTYPELFGITDGKAIGTFIEKSRTADYQTTRGLLEILNRDGNRDDIVAFLMDRNLPGDEIVHNSLADEIMASPPRLGYLTISNALQWRLQYSRIVSLTETVSGIVKIV